MLPPPAGRTWLTGVILALLCAIYLIETSRPVGNGGSWLAPSLQTLVAYGALSRDLVVERGELYRLLTGPLLHGSVLHIVMNGLALWSIGRDMERRVGATWLFVLFFLGAVGGAVGSLTLNPSDLVSVGASGAIMCLISTAFVILFRSREKGRGELQYDMVRALILSLMPLAIGSRSGIDGAAHLGGAITGGLLGGLLYFTWEEDRPTVRLILPARLLTIVALAFYADAGLRANTLHDVYGRTAGLIPDGEVPRLKDADHYLPYLLTKYPADPRTHLLWGQLLRENKDLTGAEREFRTAANLAASDPRIMPGFTRELNAELAQVLISEGKLEEGLALANPICADDNLPSSIRRVACKPN